MPTRLRLYGLLCAAHFRRHRLRLAFTTLGIAIGVASVVAILTINRSTYSSFQSTVAFLAGNAQIQITNGAAGVPQTLLSELEVLPGVRAVAGVVQEFVRVPALNGRQVCLLGVDLLQQSPIWEGQFDRDGFELRRMTDAVKEPGAVLLSATLLQEAGLVNGDRVAIVSPRGRGELTVRGSFENQRFARLFEGSVGVMDLLPAQITFGKEDRFDWIDVALDSDVDAAGIRRVIEDRVAGRAEVMSPATRGKRVESMLFTNRWLLTYSSLFAMTVSLFLIAHSMYTSTEQRTGELATLRCLGASRTDLSVLVLAEAMLVAALGSLVGLVVGTFLCRLALASFGTFISATYVQVAPAEVVVLWGDVGAAIAISFVATIAGAWLPAMLAAGTSPLRSLDRYVVRRSISGRGTLVLGVTLVVLGVALPSLRMPRTWFATQTGLALGAILLQLFGVAVLVPILLRITGLVLRPLHRRLWGPVGQWLWEQTARPSRRTSLTIGSLAAGFSFALVMAVLLASYRSAMVEWVESSFPSDLVVNVGPGLSLVAGPVADTVVGDRIAELPHVKAVKPLRFLEASLRGEPMIVQGTADALLAQRHVREPLDVASGDVAISDTLSERFDLHVGDRFELDTPTGPITLVVKVVEADYLLDIGSVKVAWSTFSHRWKEHRANLFLIDLDDPAAAAEVKAQIDATVGSTYDLTVLSRMDTRAAIDLLIASTFALMFACEALGILVAVLAVMNAVSANLIDRARDLRLLRTLGLTPSALRRLTMTEGGTLGFVGAAFGIVVGSVAAHRLLRASALTIAGFHIDVVWPYGAAATMLLLGTVSGALAARLGARSER